MRRNLPALIIGCILAATAWAQEEAADDATADAPAAEASAETDAPDTVDDSDLDEQVYIDQDDDFQPSEEIPADQSIAFPTDI